MLEEALQIAEKRREAKGKGKKVRYTHLNAEFQGIARRDKKVFFSDECKEIEENKKKVKTAVAAAAAAAKSLQSYLTLCDPIDSNTPGSSVPGILQATILEWVAISFSNA